MRDADGAGNVNGAFVAEDEQNNQPPTEVTASFLESVRLELKNVATYGGTELDPNDNTQVLNKIISIVADKTKRVGELVYYTGTTPPTNTMEPAGYELDRATYPEWWAFAQISGLLEVDDATWLANKATNGTNGKYSPGDGATTFRIPDTRGDFYRHAGGGNTVDPLREGGTFQLGTRINDRVNNNGVVYISHAEDVQSVPHAVGTVNATGSDGASHTIRPRNTAYIAVIYYK